MAEKKVAMDDMRTFGEIPNTPTLHCMLQLVDLNNIVYFVPNICTTL